MTIKGSVFTDNKGLESGPMAKPVAMKLISGKTWQGKIVVEAACIEHTANAINTLVTIMQDEEVHPQWRIAAATHILDRGHGKVVDRVAIANLNGIDGSLDGLSSATTLASLSQLSTRDLLLMASNRILSQSNQSVTVEDVTPTPGIDVETVA